MSSTSLPKINETKQNGVFVLVAGRIKRKCWVLGVRVCRIGFDGGLFIDCIRWGEMKVCLVDGDGDGLSEEPKLKKNLLRLYAAIDAMRRDVLLVWI